MSLESKNILVIGLAKTGISTIKFLHGKKANVIVNDIKKKEDLKEILSELDYLENIKFVLGEHLSGVSGIDLVVVSPGVPLDIPFILDIKDKGIEIIGEVELAYRILKSSSEMPTIIGITGTNGKTTTTSLTGELFKNAKKDTHIVGNIGNPLIDIVDKTTKESFMVSELSSFQLESIKDFTPKISVVLNVTPDHLNRHHSMENYIEAKSRIFANQKENDISIFNYDDNTTRELANKSNAISYFFSSNTNLSSVNKNGIYVDSEGYITLNISQEIRLMHKSEISLPGVHNLQNSLATALIAYSLGIDLDIIKNTLSSFRGVEHRQEFVKDIDGVRYVNDSKATNPDSTIKAINSYDRPLILIAGGMDKKNDFSELINEAKDKVKALVVLGETASELQKQARLCGFEHLVVRVYSMKDAVSVARKVSKDGDIVLLSPACASWDMYKNFEERGNEFKKYVLELDSK